MQTLVNSVYGEAIDPNPHTTPHPHPHPHPHPNPNPNLNLNPNPSPSPNPNPNQAYLACVRRTSKRALPPPGWVQAVKQPP